jgi:hypothetical protein
MTLSRPIAITVLVLLAVARTASPTAEPESASVMWRLTEQQYRNSVADIFGDDIEIRGVIRASAMTQADMQEYGRMAREIAAQIVDPRHRDVLVGCVPRDATLADDACAMSFFRSTGRFVFRRPLATSEVHAQILAAREATRSSRDFYAGLGASLAAMLSSPRFIFDIDVDEPVSAKSSARRLDAYSKASRLSFFLWNTTPDIVLLDAAAKGELHTASLLAKQVDRLLASPRVDARIKTFFSESSGDGDGCGANPVLVEHEMRLKPQVAVCLARKVAESGLRQPLSPAETVWAAELASLLTKSGYDMRPMLREIATSAAFFRVTSSTNAAAVR